MSTPENDIHGEGSTQAETHVEVEETVPQPAKPKKRKAMEKRSPAWDHFKPFVDENGKAKAKCNYCGTTLGGDTKINGTGSLHSHIRICKKIPAREDLKQSQLNFQSGSSSTTLWKFEQEEVRKALAFMVIVDELPFKFVENEGFRYFVSKACPRFKIPSRWTVPRDCFKMYTDEKNMLKALLKSMDQRVCLTTDTWSSLQSINYMCLTAHYIDNDWNLHKKILNFCTISSHRGRDIGWEIEKCLHEWGIEKVFTVTVDNASSNDVALVYLKDKVSQWGSSIRNCKHMHMRCIAHVFNLVVQDGLKEVGLSVKKIRAVVRYIRQSPARLRKFKECCEHEKIPTKSLLCLDVSTRWNSTYLMLEVAVKFEKAFSRFDFLEPGYRVELEIDDGVPGTMDWMKAKRMVSFLKIFYEITCKISGCLYVTSNVFLHEIYKVNRLLKAWIDGRDDELSKMSRLTKEKFDKYWGDPRKMNKLIFIAVILGPRYKLKWVQIAMSKMYGEDLGNSMTTELEVELIAMCNDYINPLTPETSVVQRDVVMPSVDDEDIINATLREIGDEYVSLHNADGNEVEKFLKEDNESNSPNFDILVWWKMNMSRFPVLSQIARDVLAVPISTVASESAFSTSGRVLDAFRSSLTPTIVEHLICGQDWLRKSTTPVNVEELLEDIDTLEQGLRGVTLDAPKNNQA